MPFCISIRKIEPRNADVCLVSSVGQTKHMCHYTPPYVNLKDRDTCWSHTVMQYISPKRSDVPLTVLPFLIDIKAIYSISPQPSESFGFAEIYLFSFAYN
jgi:hypothetical protein